MRELALATAVVIGLTTCGIAVAQEEEGAALDVLSVGQAMREAADQGEWGDVYSHARQIVDGTRETLKERSAEELYWVATAHMYLMAQVFEMSEQAGLPAEKAKFATDVVDWVKGSKTEEVRVISHGEQVNLEDYLVEGQTVIFDFTSKYCGPCVRLDPYLKQLAEERDDIVLVKVDINRPDRRGIDWQSPVARQFELQSIPNFKVYGPEGDLVAEGDRARQMVLQWIQELQG
ncbi:MAG: thioredoxin family protein [Armatimonadota bacterium]|nr:thioredoxin family protein [Armatimonadota bacterium]